MLRSAGLALILALGGLAAQPARAADVRHDLIGCWDYELSARDKQMMAVAPGSVADTTLCLLRNGTTTASAIVGGGQIDGHLLEMEGMDGSGRYYLSNGRLVLHGLYAFDSYGPLSCVVTFTSHDRFELSDCMDGFPDGSELSPAPPRSYLRQRKT
jgi:hypothetical protein